MGEIYLLLVRFFQSGPTRTDHEQTGPVRRTDQFKVRTKSGPGRTAKWPVLLIPTPNP